MHTVRKILVLLMLVAALGVLTGCEAESTRLPANQLLLGAGDTKVDFAERFVFPWDRVYVFVPYTTSKAIDSALGFEWPGYKGSVIGDSDAVTLVVFVKDGKVAGWFEQSREVDLVGLAKPDGYAHDDAVFSVEASGTGVGLQP